MGLLPNLLYFSYELGLKYRIGNKDYYCRFLVYGTVNKNRGISSRITPAPKTIMKTEKNLRNSLQINYRLSSKNLLYIYLRNYFGKIWKNQSTCGGVKIIYMKLNYDRRWWTSVVRGVVESKITIAEPFVISMRLKSWSRSWMTSSSGCCHWLWWRQQEEDEPVFNLFEIKKLWGDGGALWTISSRNPNDYHRGSVESENNLIEIILLCGR